MSCLHQRLSPAIVIMAPQSSAAVQRTAPIAIAPKPPRPEPSAYRQDSFQRLEMSQGAASSAPTDGASFNGSPVLPCLSCRYSRANCIMAHDDDGCVPCQVNGSECSLACSPQSRKRKLHGEPTDNVIGKRRSVVFPCHISGLIARYIPSPREPNGLFCCSLAAARTTNTQ